MKKIRKAAVIGSGVMGGGIAGLLASAGVRTLMLDIVPPDLTDEMKHDPQGRNRIVKQGLDTLLKASPALLMHPRDAARIDIGNIEDDFGKLGGCDWIIEVVVENLKVKRDLLKKIEKVRRPGTIVSTNTSGIPLKAMSEGLSLEFRQHFLGTHFFNPVRYMRLLELIPGEDTAPELLDFVAAYGEKILGKGIVWAKDTPNFIGNRIGVQGIVKAMQLMREEGLSIPAVDAVFGPVMGRPKTAMFKTADLVGLDVLAHVARNTYELVPDDEGRESYVMPGFVQAMIDNKLLGKKSRSGFYKTDLTPEWQKVRKVIDPDTLSYSEYEPPDYPCLEKARRAGTLPEKMRAVVYGDDKLARFAWKALANNLIYAANRIPEISDTIVDIDNAMKWGFNFELGPFETWDAIGLTESAAKMQRDGFEVPEKIRAMIAAGHTAFYKTENGRRSYFDFAAGRYRELSLSPGIVSLASLKGAGNVISDSAAATLIDLGDGVACLEFHTKMNALNAEILDFMAKALDFVDANGSGLVIGNQAGGMPGAFSAGADLKGILTAVKENRFADIETMVHDLQMVLQRAKYAPFPVVAAPFGLTLGGGCEVCLAVDRIVAHAELYMGLVEIGVGLLPAGGGCLNLWRRTYRDDSRRGDRGGPGTVLHSGFHEHRHGQGLHLGRRCPRQRLSRRARPDCLQSRLPGRRSQEGSPEDGGRRLCAARQAQGHGLRRVGPGHDCGRNLQHAQRRVYLRLRRLAGQTDRVRHQRRRGARQRRTGRRSDPDARTPDIHGSAAAGKNRGADREHAQNRQAAAQLIDRQPTGGPASGVNQERSYNISALAVYQKGVGI